MQQTDFQNVVVFKIRGDQLIANPSISTNSSENTATINSGYLYYSSNYTIEITAKGAINNNTELNGASGILKIRVFDEDNMLVDTYNPMNPNQYANIQNGLSGVGDNYIRFNSSVLVNNLNQSIGNSILLTNANNSFFDLPLTFENGNMAYDINPFCPIIPCFVGGGFNRVLTEKGFVFIEDLALGDKIYCVDDGDYKPVIHISKNIIKHKDMRENNFPYQYGSVLLSRQHRVLTEDDKLVSVAKLETRGYADRYDSWPGDIVYINIFLPTHEIINVNGRLVESGWLGGKMASNIIGSENWHHVMPYLDGHKVSCRE